MEKRNIVFISAVCAFVLLAMGAYYLLRPVFKVHSIRTTHEINTGDLNYMSYSTPDAENLDILIVSLKMHRKLRTFSTNDFTLSYQDPNTKSWIDLGCNGLNPFGSRHGEGDMSWMLAEPNEKVDFTSKGRGVSKYISLAFIVPIHLQNATLKFRGKTISKITRIHEESTEEIENSDTDSKIEENLTPKSQIEEQAPIVPPESVTEEDDSIYIFVDSPASFQGGEASSFLNWIQENLVYPPEASKKGINGKVIIRFIVNTKGDVTDVEVLLGVDPSLDKEAIRIVKSSPKWDPAKNGDRAVKQQILIPVTFALK